MASLMKILSLLSALAATGSALSCTQCAAYSSSCSGDRVTCLAGSVCGSSYSKTLTNGNTVEAFVRACALKSECGINGSLTMAQGTIRMGITCCNTDNCTPPFPSLPTQGNNSNGVTCRSCITADSTWCYTSDTVQCTGDENMCLLQTTQVTGLLSTAIRGCTTKSLCDLGSQTQTVGAKTTNIKFICTSGGMSVHTVLLTPTIVCLLLLKVFF